MREAVGRVYGSSIEINIAVIDNKRVERKYPDEAGYIFNAEDTFCYSQFSGLINKFQTSALVIQHEFGLFPEENHQDLLNMLVKMQKPVLMVMHTVIPTPASTSKRSSTGSGKK